VSEIVKHYLDVLFCLSDRSICIFTCVYIYIYIERERERGVSKSVDGIFDKLITTLNYYLHLFIAIGQS
jgi:hypothetical protein